MRDWSSDRIRVVMELLDLRPASLAAELKVTARAVTYWLDGDRKPTSADVLAGLGRLERRAVARLATLYPEVDPMKRNHLLKALAGAPFAWSGLPALTTSAVRRVDERYIALLEGFTTSFESAYALATPGELVDAVLGHHRTLMRLLDHTATHDAHRRLQVVTGKTALLVGMLARDGGAWSWSKHYTNEALDLALEAGHGGLEAGALANLGCLLSPALGDGSKADPERYLSYVQRANAVAEHWSPPATRSWSAAVLATAHAVAGDHDAALAARDRAERSLNTDVGADDFGGRFVGVWNEAELARRSGACALRLGRLDEAEHVIRGALGGDMSALGRAYAYTDLAELSVLREEPEQACAALARAYTEAVGTGSGASLQRIARVRQDLDPWAGQGFVRDLDELFRLT